MYKVINRLITNILTIKLARILSLIKSFVKSILHFSLTPIIKPISFILKKISSSFRISKLKNLINTSIKIVKLLTKSKSIFLKNFKKKYPNILATKLAISPFKSIIITNSSIHSKELINSKIILKTLHYNIFTIILLLNHTNKNYKNNSINNNAIYHEMCMYYLFIMQALYEAEKKYTLENNQDISCIFDLIFQALQALIEIVIIGTLYSAITIAFTCTTVIPNIIENIYNYQQSLEPSSNLQFSGTFTIGNTMQPS